MKYFIPIPETAEQLKSLYRKLAQKYHPDCAGGSTADMQGVNAEYDILFERLKTVRTNAKGERYEKETTETASDFKDIIDKLMRMENITINIIGSFVWVQGDTKPHKDELKKMGFKWQPQKLAWYKSPEGYHKRSRRQFDSLDELKEMFDNSSMSSVGKTKIGAFA